MSKIKICGLFCEVDIDYANVAKPDYIGFVFASSKRCTTKEKALAMKVRLDSHIKAVGVFVNAEPSYIIDIASQKIIDMIQLHGDEDSEYINNIKSATGLPVIKALRVTTDEEARLSESCPADILLFDSHSDNSYGGTGQVFDWSVLMRVKRPFFLAGGLDMESIPYAYDALTPYGFDVSSGVETSGFKDREKMIDIVNIVRSL